MDGYTGDTMREPDSDWIDYQEQIRESEKMNDFEGHPGHGGFYDPASIGDDHRTMDTKPDLRYTDPSRLLEEMQAVAFHRDIPAEVTADTTRVMSYIALAMIAVQMEHIATHLSNIHQTLITPNAELEPVTVAHLLKRVADALTGEVG